MNTVRKTLFFVAILLAVLLLAASVAAAQPKRVLIVVMDQMHPEYAQQYNMTNVLWLEHHGAWFPNAYVGDMASETVVSHNVMVSGLLPKHMGWSDEAFRDSSMVLGTDPSGVYVTGDLGYSDFAKLVAAGNYPKLGTYLHAKFPGTVVACAGEKSYQVRSMTAGSADFGVFLGSTKTLTNGGDPSIIQLVGGAYRPPAGAPDNTALPSYIANDPTKRFYINADVDTNNYGTLTTPPAWIYPEDGNRMVPGIDPAHLGGDDWVADATIKIMQNESWSGLFVNFGAIDKIGHMWGGGEADTITRYGWDPNSVYAQVHEPFIAKNADDQLGRLIATLKDLHEFNDTLIVVLADHGSTYAEHFYGRNAQNAGESATATEPNNWEWGYSVNDGDYYNTPTPPPGIKPLIDTGNVAFSYQSTAIETWLTDFSMPMKLQAAKVMRGLKGVIATYVKSDDGNRYILDKAMPCKMKWPELVWWVRHGQELVNTMAWPGSADVVGLLADNTSYGAIGDHGGAQKDVQRIPMVFYSPKMQHSVNCAGIRLADVMPTVLKTMDIPLTAPVDGRAYALAVHYGHCRR